MIFHGSAVDVGAEIVEKFGGRAMYYAPSAMAGHSCVSGALYLPDDLAALAEHEIAAKMHSHLDSARTAIGIALEDTIVAATSLHEWDRWGSRVNSRSHLVS